MDTRVGDAMTGAFSDRLALAVSAPRWDQPRRFEIGPEGGWIGRDPRCEVALDDHDQFLSSRHARIDYANGAFWLSDHSLNGTFVNGSASPIKADERRRLADGDVLRAGLFDIAVAIPARGLQVEADGIPIMPAGPPVTEGDDPLASLLADLMKPPTSGAAVAIDMNTIVEARGRAEAPDTGADGLDAFACLNSDADTPPVASENGSAEGFAVQPFNGAGATFWSTDRPPGPQLEATQTGLPATATAQAGEPAGDTAAAALAAFWRGLGALPKPMAPDELVAVMGEFGAALRETALLGVPVRSAHAVAVTSSDVSPSALAAFWRGLGVLPKTLSQDDLMAVMTQCGAALRVASDHCALALQALDGDAREADNPLAGGHGGLRRFLDGSTGAAIHLDDAMRDVFARVARHDRDLQAAVRAGARRMARSLSASTFEARFATTIRSRLPRNRRAELWRLFHAMEGELVDLASATFQREVARQMRARGYGRAGLPADEEDA